MIGTERYFAIFLGYNLKFFIIKSIISILKHLFKGFIMLLHSWIKVRFEKKIKALLNLLQILRKFCRCNFNEHLKVEKWPKVKLLEMLRVIGRVLQKKLSEALQVQTKPTSSPVTEAGVLPSLFPSFSDSLVHRVYRESFQIQFNKKIIKTFAC